MKRWALQAINYETPRLGLGTALHSLVPESARATSRKEVPPQMTALPAKSKLRDFSRVSRNKNMKKHTYKWKYIFIICFWSNKIKILNVSTLNKFLPVVLINLGLIQVEHAKQAGTRNAKILEIILLVSHNSNWIRIRTRTNISWLFYK